MESLIGQRIDKIIIHYRLTKNSFSKAIGKTPSYVAHIISGENKPGFEVLDSILRTYPDISAEWLMRGDGHMLKGAKSYQILDEDENKLEVKEKEIEYKNKELQQKEKEIEYQKKIIQLYEEKEKLKNSQSSIPEHKLTSKDKGKEE